MSNYSVNRTMVYGGETFTVVTRPGASPEERARRAAQRHPARRNSAIKMRRIEAVDLACGEFDPRGYFVYSLFAEDEDEPFYIGQSSNLLSRLGTHHQTFKGRIARVKVIRCESRADMDATEMALIRKHQPIFNVRGILPDGNP